MSTQREAQALAADAMGWLRSIRDASDGGTLNRIAKVVMAHLNDRKACDQIKRHFAGAIEEERQRLGNDPAAVRGKMFAAGADQ